MTQEKRPDAPATKGLVAGVAGATAITQLLAMIAGLIVVRALTKDEYALYAITAAAIGAAAVLSDSGVNSTFMAAAGAARRHGGQISPEFTLALRARRTLLAWVLPVLAVPTAWLLVANGATPIATAIYIGCLALTVIPDVTGAIAQLVLQVTGKVPRLQWILIWTAIVRVGLLAAIALVPVTWAGAYLAVGAAASCLAWWLKRRAAGADARRAAIESTSDPRYRRAIAHTLPESIALAAAPQLINVALTLAGNTAAIAEIGALSRFAAIFGIANGIIANLAAPAIARGSADRAASRKALKRVGGAYAAFAAAFTLVCAIGAPVALWLLGPEYADLGPELVIVAAGVAVFNFAQYGLGGVNFARGWTAYSWTFVPLMLIAGLAAALLGDLSTSRGAAWLYSSLALAALAGHMIRFAVGYSRSPSEPEPASN